MFTLCFRHFQYSFRSIRQCISISIKICWCRKRTTKRRLLYSHQMLLSPFSDYLLVHTASLPNWFIAIRISFPTVCQSLDMSEKSLPPIYRLNLLAFVPNENSDFTPVLNDGLFLNITLVVLFIRFISFSGAKIVKNGKRRMKFTVFSTFLTLFISF